MRGRRLTVGVILIAMALPLIWPAIPPLTDLPGHMGRYRVALGGSEALARYFDYEWRPLGNLGVDALAVLLAPMLGIEGATKAVVVAIPVLAAAGMLWISREAHGRVQPTALLALPFAYGFPFGFGFVNFALSSALAFLAFALWLRLERQGRTGLRLLVFLPISAILFLAHSFGWGVLGLAVFGAEWVRRHRLGDGWLGAPVRAGLACLPLAWPALLFLLGPPSQGGTGDWFNWIGKLDWFVSALRDRWRVWDVASLGFAAALGWLALARSGGRGWRAEVGVPALLCWAAFLLLPRILTGSNYADMRMAPLAWALTLLSIGGGGRVLWIGAGAFLAARLAGNTVASIERDRAWRAELEAVRYVPRGAAVLALVGRPCKDPIGGGVRRLREGTTWSTPRIDHLPSLAIVRRDAFANDQWVDPAGQLIRVKHPAGPFVRDPSQLVYPRGCRAEGSDFEGAIAGFDRRAFSHVWTLGFPPGRARAADLRLLWANGRSALYRVQPPALPNGGGGGTARP